MIKALSHWLRGGTAMLLYFRSKLATQARRRAEQDFACAEADALIALPGRDGFDEWRAEADRRRRQTGRILLRRIEAEEALLARRHALTAPAPERNA